MCRLTAALIAVATACAVVRSRHSAKRDGPEPDRLQPSAPAPVAACLMAARPASSAARRALRRTRARGAAAQPARQRQALADRQREAATLAEDRQQRLRRYAGGVLRGVAGQPPAVAEDVVDANAVARDEACRDLVPRI